MRRHAHATPLVRQSLSKLMLRLDAQPTAQWPVHLRLAWELLPADIADAAKRKRLFGRCLAKAHACAAAISARSDAVVRTSLRTGLAKKLRRMARCCRRAKMELRGRLDVAVGACLKDGSIDQETIEAIFDTVGQTFAVHSDEEAAQTALRAIHHVEPAGETRGTLKSDHAALASIDHVAMQKALLSYRRSRCNAGIIAADVFDVMASAFRPSPVPSTQVHDLLVDYVVELGEQWASSGLKPARGHRENGEHHGGPAGRFHRFADHLLTAIIEPDSRRHHDAVSEVLRGARRAYDRAPPSAKRIASPAPRRADVEWLVADDHVKKALRIMSVKKRA
jgi:hypothetical protein